MGVPSLCLVLAALLAAADPAPTKFNIHDVIGEHPDLFLARPPTFSAVQESAQVQCLTLIQNPTHSSDQVFFYEAATLFFQYYHEVRRELNVPDGAAISEGVIQEALAAYKGSTSGDYVIHTDGGVRSAALRQAIQLGARIADAILALSKRLVTVYSRQQDPNIDDVTKRRNLLIGDLLMWRQTTNFLRFFNAAAFWLPVHRLFEWQYNDVVVPMCAYMADSAQFVVKKDAKMKLHRLHIESVLWADLMHNLNALDIDMASHPIGSLVVTLCHHYFPDGLPHWVDALPTLAREWVILLRRSENDPDATTDLSTESEGKSAPPPTDESPALDEEMAKPGQAVVDDATPQVVDAFEPESNPALLQRSVSGVSDDSICVLCLQIVDPGHEKCAMIAHNAPFLSEVASYEVKSGALPVVPLVLPCLNVRCNKLVCFPCLLNSYAGTTATRFRLGDTRPCVVCQQSLSVTYICALVQVGPSTSVVSVKQHLENTKKECNVSAGKRCARL